MKNNNTDKTKKELSRISKKNKKNNFSFKMVKGKNIDGKIKKREFSRKDIEKADEEKYFDIRFLNYQKNKFSIELNELKLRIIRKVKKEKKKISVLDFIDNNIFNTFSDKIKNKYAKKYQEIYGKIKLIDSKINNIVKSK